MCAAYRFALPSARNREIREITISTAGTSQAGRSASASAFVHSLNILVKYVRLYGFEHKRTETQFETAWNELQAALPKAGDQGFLLGVSGTKLLLDGIPLETGQAERESREEQERQADLVRLQDDVAQMGQGLIADRDSEHLGRGDVGVIAIRRLWTREIGAFLKGRPTKTWKRDASIVPRAWGLAGNPAQGQPADKAFRDSLYEEATPSSTMPG